MNVIVTFGNSSAPATPLSPYNYQRYPTKAPAVKGTILGTPDADAAITSGGGKHYMYFRKDGRVEWLALTPECAAAISKGAAFAVTAEEVAPPTKRVRKAKTAKA